MAEAHQLTHVAMIPTPGMGHLIPMAQLANRLVHHHHHPLSVTIIVPTVSPACDSQKSILAPLPPPISSVFLPPPDLSDLQTQDLKIETVISLTVMRSLPSIREALGSIVSSGSRLAAVITDLFGTDCFHVAGDFQAAPYIFFPSTAMFLSLFLHLPKLDEMVPCEYRELEELVRIPGCLPIHGAELLDPLQDRKNDAYNWVLHHAKKYSLAEGIMVNSFAELEGRTLKALQEPEPEKPRVFSVGPLVNVGTGWSQVSGQEYCLRWLDDHPNGSVLYVSFGSGGTLSSAQITELAFGLEMSEQRFLWVVRSPSDKAANASFFSAPSRSGSFSFLPKGFLDRTKNRGLVVDSWAPQAQVLSHGSTGGFLTHCGWNSTLESVVNGIPLIAWPLYAEQKMNAFMLVEDIKVAMRPEVSGPNGIIGREQISNVVRNLMEGEEGKTLRSRMKNLKEAAARVLSEDGSSTMALDRVAADWNQHKIN